MEEIVKISFKHYATDAEFLETKELKGLEKGDVIFVDDVKRVYLCTESNDTEDVCEIYDCSDHSALEELVSTLSEKLGLLEEEFNNFKSYVESTFVVDEEISDTSTNPVQNKVVKKYIDSKIFVGTQAEYDAVADEIAESCIVIITDQDMPLEDSGATSAVLGKGVLGQLILGKV